MKSRDQGSRQTRSDDSRSLELLGSQKGQNITLKSYEYINHIHYNSLYESRNTPATTSSLAAMEIGISFVSIRRHHMRSPYLQAENEKKAKKRNIWKDQDRIYTVRWV